MFVACKGIVNLLSNCNLNVYCFRARCIRSMFLRIKCFRQKISWHWPHQVYQSFNGGFECECFVLCTLFTPVKVFFCVVVEFIKSFLAKEADIVISALCSLYKFTSTNKYNNRVAAE